jgi:hypothetical protein
MDLGYESLKAKVAPEGNESWDEEDQSGATVPNFDAFGEQANGIFGVSPQGVPASGIRQ